MKRSGFSVKPRKPLARSPFKASNKPKARRKAKKVRVVGGVALEAWIKAIPENQSHGSGTLQKRLWRITSDYVRIRDWYKFNGRCVATGKYIERWQDGQAGHFKAYGACRGIYKFVTDNIHLQSESSNKWNNSDTWFNFAAEIKKRWGYTKEMIDQSNSETSLKTLSGTHIKDKIEDTLIRMATLPEQPEYFQRVMMLKEQSPA